MIFGAIGDTSYDIVRFLHVLTAIVGFGSTFVYAVGGKLASELRGEQALGITKLNIKASEMLTTPVIWAVGVLGFGLVFMSDEVWEFEQAWISLSILIFVAAAVTSWFVLRPTAQRILAIQEELVAAGPPAGGAPAGPPPGVAELEKLGKKMGAVSGVLHLSFLVILYLMIFKPGL